VPADGVAAASRDSLERPLERGILERLDLPAVVAHEVVVMLPTRMGRLESRDAVAEIDALHETELVQALEGAIDARDPDSHLPRPHPLVDLLCRYAAVLGAEELDDRPPRSAAPSRRRPKTRERLLGPGRPHDDNDIRSHRRATFSPVRRLLGLLSVALVVVVAGCGGVATESGKETVVAAFYPLAWAAQEIGGGGVDVHNLTPPGAEPHDIELTPRDVDRIRKADLVLFLGDGFQPALEKAVQDRHGPSVDLLRGLRLAAAPKGEEKLAVDPHVWLDPVRFAALVKRIGRALHRPRPASRLATRLGALDREYRRSLSSCRRREIVTSHAAFGYLAARYGLRQIPLTGLSPEAEPGPRAVQRLVHEVESSGAPTVFFESLVSPKLAQTVAREAGAKTAVLDPIEGLTKDELAAGDDYVSLMRRNLETLRKALACR
jgi:zinc transport system substrate-binding protein